jgi:hypothetical protein
VLASKIEYLADWNGIASWAHIKKHGFDQKFKLIVDDERANLAVLRRIGGARRKHD